MLKYGPLSISGENTVLETLRKLENLKRHILNFAVTVIPPSYTALLLPIRDARDEAAASIPIAGESDDDVEGKGS